MRACIVVLAGLIAGSAGAQSLIVPTGFETSDAPFASELAGVSVRMRQQFVIAGSLLAPLQGKTLDAIWFRRNAGIDEPLSAGHCDLTLELSAASVAPASASQAFASNHGAAPIVVFSGAVAVPASAATGNDRWAADQTIRITFTKSFLYLGGNLCLEVRGAPNPSARTPWWLIDAACQAHDGHATLVGTHCSAHVDAKTRMLTVGDEELMLGATATFVALGQRASLGYLMLGRDLGSPGSDLSPFGLTGCTLRTDGAIAVGVPLDRLFPVIGNDGPGVGHAALGIPNDRVLLGGTLLVQLANLETAPPLSNGAGVTLSQGLSCTLASQPPSLGICTVTSVGVAGAQALPDTGVVVPNRGPVVKLFAH